MNKEEMLERTEVLKWFEEETAPILKQIIEAIEKTVEEIAREIIPIVEDIVKWICTMYESIISQSTNKRILHLALHHRRERVRKKNVRRVKKRIQRRCAE